MASLRNEAPKAPRGAVGCEERCSLPPGDGSGEVAMPLSNFFRLLSSKWHVLVHSVS